MADELPGILGEATRFGSKLTEVANKQLRSLATEIRGDAGKAARGQARDRINIGTLATDAMRLIGTLGEIVVELSKYDLVRSDIPPVRLVGTNAVARIAPDGEDIAFLIENDGAVDRTVTIVAALIRMGAGEHPEDLARHEDQKLYAGERRRLMVRLPLREEGEYALRIRILDGESIVTTQVFTFPIAAKSK
jgi:hypothetical protein